MKTNRILSLLTCVLLMCATAICVNKALFGHEITRKPAAEPTVAQTDTITTMPDGTTVIHTAALTNIAGYAGPVPLDISIADGKIAAITPLENTETPRFFERTTVLFDEWLGKTPEEALNQKVDAISGATYTSTAIITNMNAGLSYYLDSQKTATPTMPWKLWVALGVTLAACIVPLFVRNRIYTYVQQVANVVVLGFWCGQFLDYSLILKYL